MVVLMGGKYSQGYQLFQSLTVKAFLAVRPYAEQIINTVQLMLDTGLPSFKGEPTIRRLKDRFTLHLNDRQAAEFMMGIIRNAHENVRSTAYDEFQRVSIGFHHHNFVHPSSPVTKRYVKCHLILRPTFTLEKEYHTSLKDRPHWSFSLLHLKNTSPARKKKKTPERK